jgi:peptidoglycan/LPS O-acetylase OafA/YrhL
MRLAFESIVEKTSSIRRFLTGRSTALTEKNNFETGHLNYLNGLRAVAALYVLLHHAILQVNISSSSSGIVNWLHAIFEHGRFAVDLFIVISGFCLMLPVIQNDGVLKKGALNFFVRRAKRILPTYYLAMGLSLILIYTVIGKKQVLTGILVFL